MIANLKQGYLSIEYTECFATNVFKHTLISRMP